MSWASGPGPGPSHKKRAGLAHGPQVLCPMSYDLVLCPMALSYVLWPCAMSYGPVLCPMALSYVPWVIHLALCTGGYNPHEEQPHHA